MDTIVNDLLSYKSIINNRQAFRKASGKSSDDFNILDFPSHKFFKILFYFWNDPDEDKVEESGGLLAPTWDVIGNLPYWEFTSAWSYLKNNAEEERAEKLKKFINLLSNISTYSPWYFKSVSGIDAALERKQPVEGSFKIEDQRKQISIACLPDAFDDRIGTLLDLYRDIVWSWQTKREILPANLRKFDMGIYIYESPIKGFHNYKSFKQEDYAVLKQGASNEYQTSYKYIEFHNCEIDYNSSKSGYGNVNNQEGFTPEYIINILYDDCYESRYNELMERTIGDLIQWDSVQTLYSENDALLVGDSVAQGTPNSYYNNSSYCINQNIMLDNRLHSNDPGFLTNVIGQAIMPGVDFVSTKLKGALLGNLHGYSLSKFGSQLKDLANGNVIGVVDAGIDYANKAKTTHYEKKENIFNGLYSKHANVQDLPGQLVKLDKQTVTSLGNLYKTQAIVNNL